MFLALRCFTRREEIFSSLHSKVRFFVQVPLFCLYLFTDLYSVVQFLIDNYKEIFDGVEEERELFTQKLAVEGEATQSKEAAARAEKRKEIKQKKMQEEKAREGSLTELANMLKYYYRI